MGVIPILNKEEVQIATMRETAKARPILIFTRLQGADAEGSDMEGEILGGKRVQMELFQKRLGHTSQSVIVRLVREKMVRGLEEGLKGEFGMCRGYEMGGPIEKIHHRKDSEFRANEPPELIHTNIVGLFEPKAIEGGGKYNQVIIDVFSKKSWTIPLKLKSDTKVALKEWISVRENEVGRRVKTMRSEGRVHRCIPRNMAKGTRNHSSDYPCKVSSKQWGGGEDE